MNNKYIVRTVDELNVQVMENVEKKVKSEDGKWVGSGEYSYKTISYHPNLEQAYKWIVDKELNVCDFEKLEQVVAKIEELKAFIKAELSA